MTRTRITPDQRDAAIAQLRETFPTGSVVSTVVRHVSSSGMQRAVVVLAPDRDGGTGVANVSWQVARALGWSLHPRHDGVKVNGAGMDMTFHLVYTLAQTLHGDGYALGSRNIA